MQPDRPLAGVRVLFTRAAESSDDRPARLLSELGASVDQVPLIRIGPPPNRLALREAAASADAYACVAFASAHGVNGFAAERGAPLKNPPSVAAVGAETAAAVQRLLGRPADIVPARFVAEELAAEIARAVARPARILLVQATDARPVLALRLAQAGFDVTSVAAYSTIESPPRDLAHRIRNADAIVLASGSAVRSLVKGIGASDPAAALRGKALACIGPVTESEARRAGLHVEIVSKQATFESLAQALADYYRGGGREPNA